MRTVKGNKTLEITKEDFQKVLNQYSHIVIDVGTGDGRFIYEGAISNPNNLYIGLDPAEKQLLEYSKKAVRKKLDNIIFCVASIENIPLELNHVANKVTINLPWGSLLEKVAVPSDEIVRELSSLLKKFGDLEIILGYDSILEPNETKRLNLQEINVNYIKDRIIPVFEENGFTEKEFKELNKEDLQNIKSNWGKKLVFGQNRPFFRICFTYN